MTSPDIGPLTLMEVLEASAVEQPEKVAYTFLADGENQEQTLTYGDLDRRARQFAAGLQRKVKPGERALLIFPSGLNYLVAFVGCLYAGVIAVPINSPHPKRDVPRLRHVLRDAQAAVACGEAALLEQIPALLSAYPEFAGLGFMASEDLPEGLESAWRRHEPLATELAFLQYTSGSTSEPKGCMISNANLIHTIRDLAIAGGLDREGIVANWLPVFHDLGLSYGLLYPAYAGASCVFMSPTAFLQTPTRWLRMISKYGCTHTTAPNFAYELCAQRITEEERRSINLGTLQVAGNASEPVRLGTMKRFAKAMEPCGFRFEVFVPGYGLAESTVKVCQRRLDEPLSTCALDPEALKKNRIRFLAQDDLAAYHSVGLGGSSIGADILIVNPEARTESAADEIGEIWVRSLSVAQGYWGKPEETRETFQAYLADSGTGPFLRTGDLGFVHEGQLHVAGRIKDLVIIAGRNHHPQDIELSAQEAHEYLQLDSGAAFAVGEDGTERLVIVQEVRREKRGAPDLESAAQAMRMAIAREHGLRAAAVLLVPPLAVPKTSSGKIQRTATREAYLRGQLTPLFEWHAPQ